jgi:sirohydrochlorin cobaltochelatase
MSLILFAHGARDPNWRLPFEALRDSIAAQLQARTVQLAFLELMQPSLIEAIDAQVAAGATHIDIAPIFLAAGSHIRQDLPKLLDEARARHPQTHIACLPVMGELAPIRDAIAQTYVSLLNHA